MKQDKQDKRAGQQEERGYSILTMDHISYFLMGAAVGAVLMYVFDPIAGGRRRALAQDKVNKLKDDAIDYVERQGADLMNRAKGTVAESRNLM